MTEQNNQSDAPASELAARINELEAELADAVRWRDVYLRERNEEMATFMRRAGELWQPLYDHVIAKLHKREGTTPVSETDGAAISERVER